MDDMPELYLTAEDAMTWLGIVRYRLNVLVYELGIQACDKRTCRYTAPQLRRIKALNDQANNIGVSPRVAGKIQRAIERQKAAKQNGGEA